MFRWIAQTITVANLGVRTIPQRLSSSAVAIIGIAGVVIVFVAILTMYTAVATRSREIATLRALGFNTVSVLISVLAEALALAAIGGAIGGTAAYLAFNG